MIILASAKAGERTAELKEPCKGSAELGDSHGRGRTHTAASTMAKISSHGFRTLLHCLQM